MRPLSMVQRRVLSTLEEAGEENLCALLNGVANPSGEARDVEVMRAALDDLLSRGVIELAVDLDPASRRWIPLRRAHAFEAVDTIGDRIEWSRPEELWLPRAGLPPLQVLLNRAGLALAREILSIDGWPDKQLDGYEY